MQYEPVKQRLPAKEQVRWAQHLLAVVHCRRVRVSPCAQAVGLLSRTTLLPPLPAGQDLLSDQGARAPS